VSMDGEDSVSVGTGAEANSYQSPMANCGKTTPRETEIAPKSSWLVRASLGLAIFLEVLPTEIEYILVAMQNRSLLTLFLTKLVCLTIILLPLYGYISLNGSRGLKAASGKITAIIGIVCFHLIADVFVVIQILWPKA
jgi:hypothetical protein